MTHSPPHGFRNTFCPLSILYYAFCFQAPNSFLFCNPDLNHVKISVRDVRDFRDKKITIKDFHLGPAPTEPISEEEMEQMLDMMECSIPGNPILADSPLMGSRAKARVSSNYF